MRRCAKVLVRMICRTNVRRFGLRIVTALAAALVFAAAAQACSEADDSATVVVLGNSAAQDGDEAVSGDTAGGVLTSIDSPFAGQSITVYSGRNESLIGPLIKSFEDATGVNVDVRYGNSTDLALLLEIEGLDTPADVFISQSPGAIEYLSSRGLLALLPERLTEEVPEILKGDDGDWTGLSGRRRVLVYNTELVGIEELPLSVLELTAEKYAGRVAIAPANSSFQDFVTLMRTEIGDERTKEWLRGMADNRSPAYATNSAIVDAVVRGEVDMGLVNHYYMLRYLDESPDAPGANHNFLDDDVGSAVLVTGVGILEDEDLNPAAQAFVEYMLSEKAQQYYFSQTREYPVKLELAVPAFLEPLPSVHDARILQFDELAGGLAATQDLIAQSGIR